MSDKNVNIDEKKALQKIKNRIRKRLVIAGEFVRSAAAREVVANGLVDTGNLAGSIEAKPVSWNKVRIGTNVVYAAIHEFGGKIKAKNAGALTIPLTKEARLKTAGDFPDLFILKTKKNTFLARNKEDGQIEFVYLLKKSVTIPARPYLRPALYNNKKQVMRILADD